MIILLTHDLTTFLVIEFNEKIKNLKPPKTIHESVDTLLPDRIPIMDSIHSISIGKTTNMFYKRNKVFINYFTFICLLIILII